MASHNITTVKQQVQVIGKHFRLVFKYLVTYESKQGSVTVGTTRLPVKVGAETEADEYRCAFVVERSKIVVVERDQPRFLIEAPADVLRIDQVTANRAVTFSTVDKRRWISTATALEPLAWDSKYERRAFTVSEQLFVSESGNVYKDGKKLEKIDFVPIWYDPTKQAFVH